MAVDVRSVSGDVLGAEWAIAYSDDGDAYLLVREGALCERVVQEAWSEWERLRAGDDAPLCVNV